jgi:hypothetical protein
LHVGRAGARRDREAVADATERFAGWQSWRPDPWGRFEQRYFSQGAPTHLVRTGHVEALDEPIGPFPDPGGSSDPMRADAADPLVFVEAAPLGSRWAGVCVTLAALAPVVVLTAFAGAARSFVIANLLILYTAVALLVLVERRGRSGVLSVQGAQTPKPRWRRRNAMVVSMTAGVMAWSVSGSTASSPAGRLR